MLSPCSDWRLHTQAASFPHALIGDSTHRPTPFPTIFRRPTPLRHYVYAAGQLWLVGAEEGEFDHDAHANALKAHSLSSAQKQHSGGISGGVGAEQYWLELLQMLQKSELLPSVIFSFSKVKCDEIAFGFAGRLKLISPGNTQLVGSICDECLGRLPPEDRSLQQVVRCRELLQCGVGVHHSGLLPIIREMIEILFSRGLIKVLFATETFAVGVNMPARAVVFNGVRKNDGRSFRELLPGEYTQMSGRAGRRGIDAHGAVIVAGELIDAPRLQAIVVGNPPSLTSKFTMT